MVLSAARRFTSSCPDRGDLSRHCAVRPIAVNLSAARKCFRCLSVVKVATSGQDEEAQRCCEAVKEEIRVTEMVPEEGHSGYLDSSDITFPDEAVVVDRSPPAHTRSTASERLPRWHFWPLINMALHGVKPIVRSMRSRERHDA